jgi:glucose-1-phosphate cytidylyltransferase
MAADRVVTLRPVKTMILCGGLGTRLREETEYRPKPLVEIGGRPILWHIMKLYSHYGFTSFVLCLGYRGDMIRDYFLNYREMNSDVTVRLEHGREEITYHDNIDEDEFEVTLAETGHDTMTGGRLKIAARHLDDGPFMATYGDGVGDVDIEALLEFHRSHGKLATVTTVRPPSRFGVIELAEDSSVGGFREKPRLDDWVSAGYFVFEPEVLDYLTPESVLEEEPLRRLAHEGQLSAYRHEGFWAPMDTYRDRVMLDAMYREGAPWKVW